MRFKILPNGIQKLVHDKSKNVRETEYRIRFRMLWNGICNPFHKKIAIFLWNGIQKPFQNVMKRIL